MGNKMKNRVCLLIPYYESGVNLTKSLDSVRLGPQDLVIIIDDGSIKHPAAKYCPAFVAATPVILLVLSQNQGITAALRAGLRAVPAEFSFIARLDCGDTCAAERFDLQRSFLEQCQTHGLVGSWANFVDPNDNFLYTEKYPAEQHEIKKRMRVNSAFCHPGVMFRRSVYEATTGYSDHFPAAEDYALFHEMIRITQAANIPQPLVQCVTSDGGISETRRRQQLWTRARVIIKYFDWHPLNFYGLIRACAQVITPRRFTTFIKAGMTKISFWFSTSGK